MSSLVLTCFDAKWLPSRGGVSLLTSVFFLSHFSTQQHLTALPLEITSCCCTGTYHLTRTSSSGVEVAWVGHFSLPLCPVATEAVTGSSTANRGSSPILVRAHRGSIFWVHIVRKLSLLLNFCFCAVKLKNKGDSCAICCNQMGRL